METATVGEVQKNFAQVLRRIKSGLEIVVIRRGRPVAKITALDAQKDIDWPDFYADSLTVRGKPLGEIVIEGRGDRF